MASPSAVAPALKYRYVNTETSSPGETKGLMKTKKIIILDEIEFRGEKLLLEKLEYCNKLNNKENKVIRIYGTENSIKLLSDEDCTQYFIDCTYKCVPKISENSKNLLLLMAYNAKYDLFEICVVAILSHEDWELFYEFYSHLKNVYKFSSKKFTYDFALGNINTLKNVFKDEQYKALPCYFHLIQCWWRKANKLGLGKQKYAIKTKTLIFNLKLLPFLEKRKAIDFHKKIKEEIGLFDENFT